MKRFWLFAMLLAGTLVALNAPAFAKDAEEGGSSSADTEDINSAIGGLASRVSNLEHAVKVEIHGFAETDAIVDDTRSFTEVVGNAAVVRPGSFAGDNGWSQLSMRNSRIALLATSDVEGWKAKGYIEADFLGYDPAPAYASAPASAAGTNSEINFYVAPTLRLRHAYLDLQKDGWDIMAGQYWTLFGWNMDYVLASVDVQPVMGTLYERTPRIGVMKTIGNANDMQVQIAVDAERPEQKDSGLPNLNAGLRFVLNSWKGRFSYATGAASTRALSVGISATERNYVWPLADTAAASNVNFLLNNVWGQSVAVDALIPLLPFEEGKDNPSAVVTGEWTMGSGYADALNGYTGGQSAMASSGVFPNMDAGIAGFDTNGNFTLIQEQSFNGQLQIHLPPSIGTFLTVGYGETFSPNVSGLTGAAVNGTTVSGANQLKLYNDDMCMFANVMQDISPNIRVGVEYARFDTHYSNSPAAYGGTNAGYDAIDHRVQLSTWYRF